MLWFFRVAFAALALGVAGASVSNVLLDNAEVRALAEATACNKTACHGPTRVERTPFGQTFDFVTKTHTTVTVRCTRSLILVGAYSCARE